MLWLSSDVRGTLVQGLWSIELYLKLWTLPKISPRKLQGFTIFLLFKEWNKKENWEKKATLLTKNFMEETLRKVGLQGGQNFDSKNWGQWGRENSRQRKHVGKDVGSRKSSVCLYRWWSGPKTRTPHLLNATNVTFKSTTPLVGSVKDICVTALLALRLGCSKTKWNVMTQKTKKCHVLQDKF